MPACKETVPLVKQLCIVVLCCLLFVAVFGACAGMHMPLTAKLSPPLVSTAAAAGSV
jgi:hypothetical protein